MDLQEQLFKAIEIVIDGKLESFPKDSYIECIIDSDIQETNGAYKIKYMDTVLEAFPISNSLYNKDDIVYVMAIGGDLSKKKVILTQKSKSGEPYVDLTKIEPSESKTEKNYVKNVGGATLLSGTSEVQLELLTEIIADMTDQTNLVISANIESVLAPTIGGDYGISIVVSYEDGINRDYTLSLNKITGNIYHAIGYHDTAADLCVTSKPIGIISSKLFIKGFDPLLVNNYVKFSNIKVGFLDKVIAEIIDNIIYRVDIASSSGLTFKNNTGGTILTATVFKGMSEADVAETLVYTWKRKDNSGDYISFSGGSPTKTGRTLIVLGEDVLHTNTYEVIVKENAETLSTIALGMITLANVEDGPEGPPGTGKDANLLDWVKEWDDNKVKINDSSILSPRIFAGVNEGTSEEPMLTGLALGRDILGSGNTVKGMTVYSKNIPTIQIKTDGWAIFGSEEGRQFIIKPDGSIITPQISIGDLSPHLSEDLGLQYLQQYLISGITYGLDSNKPLLR